MFMRCANFDVRFKMFIYSGIVRDLNIRCNLYYCAQYAHFKYPSLHCALYAARILNQSEYLHETNRIANLLQLSYDIEY